MLNRVLKEGVTYWEKRPHNNLMKTFLESGCSWLMLWPLVQRQEVTLCRALLGAAFQAVRGS